MSAPLPLKDFPGEDGGLCAGPAVLSAIMAVYFQMRQLDSQCCEDGGLLRYAVEAIPAAAVESVPSGEQHVCFQLLWLADKLGRTCEGGHGRMQTFCLQRVIGIQISFALRRHCGIKLWRGTGQNNRFCTGGERLRRATNEILVQASVGQTGLLQVDNLEVTKP